MDYLEKMTGLASETDYPYVQRDQNCKFSESSTPAEVSISGYKVLKSNDLSSVLEAVVQQPIAVSVAASFWSFYSSGVFTACQYNGNMDIDHLVQLVGYNKASST